ncbi:MAG: hypothetical protein K2P87_12175 [Lachnospiraceae bacterium]|nr:hypothetical protein [Lachnospiraceae bacterium]
MLTLDTFPTSKICPASCSVDGQIYGNGYPFPMFPVLIFPIVLVRVEKLIHGNIQQNDDFEEDVQAWVLAPVFHIHDGARGAVYKLGKILLRLALFFPFTFDFPAQGMRIKIFFILVHFYITSISFYISGEYMRTKYNFIFRQYFISFDKIAEHFRQRYNNKEN